MNSPAFDLANSPSPDILFLQHLETAIERAGRNKKKRVWKGTNSRAKVLRPLLLGYNGASNTGSDIRVLEMVRQFRRIFDHVPFEPVLFASGPDFFHPGFEDCAKEYASSYFPDFLAQAMERYTGVIACEGSMFTSTFSNALTGMFAGAIGYARASGHLAVGYGAEAAAMTPSLEAFVRAVCRGAVVFSRNGNSLTRLNDLGISALPGADPAWTYEPAAGAARNLLFRAGWNGNDRVAAICPINPFCWPVTLNPNPPKAACGQSDTAMAPLGDFVSYSWSQAAARKYDAYLGALAEMLNSLRTRGYFPLLVGMQDIDMRSCEDLNRMLPAALPIVARGGNDIDEIVGLLHDAALIVSSRFHATVIGMSSGVPCIGVSMDSRIESLFSENGLGDWLLRCDAEDLRESLISRIPEIDQNREQLREQYGRLTARQIRAFGQMGLDILDEIANTYEGFPSNPAAISWDACLPPVSSRIAGLMCDYA